MVYSSSARIILDLLNDRVERVFSEVLCRDISERVMRTYVVDGDPSILYQLAEEEEPKSDVLGSRTVGGVTGDV